MKSSLDKFWKWYEKHKTLNIGIASVLFTLQLVHLYWLTTDVVAVKLFEKSLYNHSLSVGIYSFFVLIVDYLEIPAIISTSILYLNELRIRFNTKSILFLLFINSQWLHIFWITDEFVLEHILSHKGGTILPLWLAWIAILIDYLELPVIYDVLKKFLKSLRREGFIPALKEIKGDSK
jgi:hypothetical protein